LALGKYDALTGNAQMDVNLHEEKCKDALDGLVTRSLSLISLSNKVIQDAEFREDDHLGFMGLCFLSRQIDHLQCMVMLTHHRDAMLIARSMIEGLCMVKWAQLIPHERPLKWRAFGYIYDWRILRLKVASGESVDPLQQEKIESALAEYGQFFYTNEARIAHGEGRELPKDPYHKDWKCGTQIKQICESVGGSVLHREIYSTFSDWHHWGTATMAESLSFSEDKVLHTSSSASKSAMALATGIQCLIETAELVNQHLGLGKELQLSAIHDEYLAWNKECGHLDEGVPSST
jgi:hypothetical protein